MAGIDFFRKCLELEEQYNSKHLKINHAIQTNGYELDEEWCAFLSQNHFLVGLSVDGVKATMPAGGMEAARTRTCACCTRPAC